MSDILDRLKTWFKQWRCNHYSRETTHEIVDCGYPLVESKTVCLDCGKGVPRDMFESATERVVVMRMLKDAGDVLTPQPDRRE